MVSNRLVRRAQVIANANVQAGMDAAVTIAARTHGMMWPDGRPAEQAREVQLMVQEKVDAVVAGAFAAQAAWNALFIKAAFSGVRSPNDLSYGLAGIMQAAGAPARRTVRANARRLTGSKPLP
jgi:hypothetical protein